ncbi:MAG TPA: MoaD/ThiS family protein [Tepidisphaeraceae bacterium]|jgi:molybdopterin converting factor small subunit|nr:MoaD/ThiS family protein [Tepidisphaeraceae bacterium]
MKVVVEYHGQMRAAAGKSSEQFEIEAGCTVGKLLEGMDEKLTKLKGLTFVGATQVNEEKVLREGDVLVLISPIAGG